MSVDANNAFYFCVNTFLVKKEKLLNSQCFVLCTAKKTGFSSKYPCGLYVRLHLVCSIEQQTVTTHCRLGLE